MRLHRLTGWRVLPGICALLATASLAFNTAKVKLLFASGSWSVVAQKEFQWRMTAMLVVGAAADLLITAALCTALLRMRSGVVPTGLLIYRLVSFAFGEYPAS